MKNGCDSQVVCVLSGRRYSTELSSFQKKGSSELTYFTTTCAVNEYLCGIKVARPPRDGFRVKMIGSVALRVQEGLG